MKTTDFCREADKVKYGKVLKENYIAGGTWSSGKLSILKKNTATVDRYQ